jgi:hypothetical protein
MQLGRPHGCDNLWWSAEVRTGQSHCTQTTLQYLGISTWKQETVLVLGNVVTFECCNTQVSQVPIFHIICREASQPDLGSVVSLQ